MANQTITQIEDAGSIEEVLPEPGENIQEHVWATIQDHSFGDVPAVRFEITNISLGSREDGVDDRLCFALTPVPEAMDYLLNHEAFEPKQMYCSLSQDFKQYNRDNFGCAWLEPKLVRREADAVKTVLALSGVVPLRAIDQIGSDLGELCDRRFKRAVPNNG